VKAVGLHANPCTVIAGLDPTIHPLGLKRFFSMDARGTSAFTRVFDALLPGHDELREAVPVMKPQNVQMTKRGPALIEWPE